ncbi:hypothetical protein C8R43DRAFT_1133994 [Mycena crocata]|nr:hypothetical protein C8R43DRAFT_1133994 [Mycena crocata]
MPDAATQTEVEASSIERKFKQEVLDFVQGRRDLPSSEVLMWLGSHIIPMTQRPRDPKELESVVMEQVRKERSEYLKHLREGWEERNVGREWLQFYPSKKPVKPQYPFEVTFSEA